MEAFFFILAVAYLLGVPIALILLIVGQRQLRDRVARIELRALRRVDAPPADVATAREPERPATEARAPASEPDRPAPGVVVATEDAPPPLPGAGAPRTATGPSVEPETETEDDEETTAEPAVEDQGPPPLPPKRPLEPLPKNHRFAPTPPPRNIDWEQWVGVRGAAVVGGIALALAGFFFVQVAIERGWLGPAARDTLALVVGLLGLAAHRPLLARGYRALGESIGGAGAVLVYGASWAASRLHGLVPEWLALLVMASTTGTAMLLAARSNAQILGAFALVGGFATPLLLNTFERGTTTVFAYALLLNLGLVTLARARKWAWMMPLAVVGTTLVQLAWYRAPGADHSPWVSALVLGGSAVFFSALRGREDGGDGPRAAAHLAVVLGLFAPLLTAFQGAAQPAPGDTLWPWTALFAVLVCGASIASRRYGSPADAVWAAAVAALTLAYASFQMRLGRVLEPDVIWSQWAISAVGIAGLLAALVRFGASRTPAYTFALLSLFVMPLTAVVETTSDVEWPYALTVAALSAVGVFASPCTRLFRFAGAVVGAFAGNVVAFHLQVVYSSAIPFDSPLGLAVPALAVLGLAAGGWDRPESSAARAFAAIVTVPALLGLTDRSYDSSTMLHAAMLVLPGIAASVTLQRERSWTPVTMWAVNGAAAIVLLTWFEHAVGQGWRGERDHLVVGTFVVLAVAPIALAFARHLDAERGEVAAWGALLTAAVVPFAPSEVAWALTRSQTGLHVLLLGAAALYLVPGFVIDRRDPRSRPASVLLSAGLSLAGLSLAHAAASQWPAVAFVLAGASFTAMAGRARSPVTAALGAATATAAAAALVIQTFGMSAFLREPLYVPIQLTIDHALVVAGLVVAALGLRALPVEAEARKPFGTAVVIALLVVLFGWVNAVVLNHFATGDRIRIETERLQARDLSLSLAWALFGAMLLAIGMARRVAGLRWASLVVLVATVLKVFLHDLGALTGLSRVASFLGLAVCLLGVSLLYARVLGRDFERWRGGGDILPSPHDDDLDDDVPDREQGGVAPPGRG